MISIQARMSINDPDSSQESNHDSSQDDTLDKGNTSEVENIAAAATSTSISTRKRARKNVITPSLAAALDRTKLSDRKATFVVAATAKSLGHNLDELNVSHSTIRRARASVRTEYSRNLKEQFRTSAALVFHWDGKLLPDLRGKEQLVDRLPVIVSGSGSISFLEYQSWPKGLKNTRHQRLCVL